MAYPGLAYIGSGKISGLYGLNETIHDQKSMGLQHLYVDTYQKDLIYAGLSVLKADDTCYYGDRIKPKAGHPRKLRSFQSFCDDGFVFVDSFNYDNFLKTDRASCISDYQLAFSSHVVNKTDEVQEIELTALVVTGSGHVQVSMDKGMAKILINGQVMRLISFETDPTYRLSIESPSGFMYHGIQDLLFDENRWSGETKVYQGPIAFSVGKKVFLDPGQGYELNWILDFTPTHESGFVTVGKKHFDIVGNEELKNNVLKTIGKEYWDQWLSSGSYDLDKRMKVNIIALKAINMDGFIPADLTGHYFASHDIAFYVRDALHGAKAFLYCGFYDECRRVIDLVMRLSRKENHELFQRYNSRLVPDEGANNNVFSQIDVIGYLLSLVADYYDLTGQLVVNLEDLMKEVEILNSIERKNGLFGPEGGVNEGVYGPAFITSTNIFIAAGLNRLKDLMSKLNKGRTSETLIIDRAGIVKKLDSLVTSIKDTFLEDGYYGYGYVEYHDQLIKRYDTPQLFGAGLGYPIDDTYKMNFNTLTNIATYYEYGYGYSEQQYHDGPWLFNTAYGAQNAYLLGDMELYMNIMDWIENHKNEYGMLPEAVDARNEDRSFINPLMWANAEYLCAMQSDIIKTLREGESYDSCKD